MTVAGSKVCQLMLFRKTERQELVEENRLIYKETEARKYLYVDLVGSASYEN